MKIRNIAPIVCGIVIGAALGALMGGGFIHTIIAQFLCIWIAAPALILLAIAGIERLRHRDRPRATSGFMIGCAAVALTILGFTAAGAAAFHYRESEVRDFVKQVLPLLDEHKKQTGSYPLQLQEVTDKGLPYHFKESGRYTSDGTSFTFYYENADSIMSGLLLTDSHRRWSRAD
jgi:hypothetical protein